MTAPQQSTCDCRSDESNHKLLLLHRCSKHVREPSMDCRLMNDVIYKFKRYEDDSLSYAGIDKHEGEKIGGFDTVLTRQEFEEM